MLFRRDRPVVAVADVLGHIPVQIELFRRQLHHVAERLAFLEATNMDLSVANKRLRQRALLDKRLDYSLTNSVIRKVAHRIIQRNAKFAEAEVVILRLRPPLFFRQRGPLEQHLHEVVEFRKLLAAAIV